MPMRRGQLLEMQADTNTSVSFEEYPPLMGNDFLGSFAELNDNELEFKTNQFVVEVSDNDVLSGRGNIVNNHKGNLHFRRLVAQTRSEYEDCKKSTHKNLLALSVVFAIERQGGRFLKKNEATNTWFQISRKEAICKTAQAYRDKAPYKRQRPRREDSSLDRDSVTMDDSYSRSDESSLGSPRGHVRHLSLTRSHTQDIVPESCQWSNAAIASQPNINQNWGSFSHHSNTGHGEWHHSWPMHDPQSQGHWSQPQQRSTSDLWISPELEQLLLSEPDAMRTLSSGALR